MADHELKCVKEELATLKAQMSKLLRSHSLIDESNLPSNETTSTTSTYTTVADASSSNSKKGRTSVWDVDDESSLLERRDYYKVSPKKHTGIQDDEENSKKSMSGKMEKVETFCMVSKAKIEALEANFKSSEANIKLLECKLKMSEEKVGQLQEALIKNKLENETILTVLKSNECQAGEKFEQLQSEMALLESDLKNSKKMGEGKIEQVKVDVLKIGTKTDNNNDALSKMEQQTKSDFNHLHTYIHGTKRMIWGRLESVYKSMSLAPDQRKKGKYYM